MRGTWSVFSAAYRKVASGDIAVDGNAVWVWDLRDLKGKRPAPGIYQLAVQFDGDKTIMPVVVLP